MTQTRNLAATLLPVGVLIVAMTSVQSGASLAKSLFPLIGAEGTTTLRLVFAAIFLILVLRPWRARINTGALGSVVAYGVALGFMNLLFYMSLRTVPLGVAVALEFTGPLAVAIFSSRRLLDFVWIALAVIGLLLLLPVGADATGIDPLGAAYALGAGVCWGLYIIFGQRAGADHGMQSACLGVIVAAFAAAPFGMVHAGTDLLDLALIPTALGVALLSTAIPYTLEMYALQRMPARTFGTLMSIEPALGAFSGLLFLGERLTLLQWAAIGAIILASVGTTASMKRKEEVQGLIPAD